MEWHSYIQDPQTSCFQYVFNLMQMYRGKLKFFEIRDLNSFFESHLKISINIPIDFYQNSNLDLPKLVKEQEVSRLRRYCIIISYSPQYEYTAYKFKEMISSIKCKEIHLLCDIEKFLIRYNFLTTNFKKLSVVEFPNEIIPRTLFLGNQNHAHNSEIIEVLGITHILNVTKSALNMFPNIKYRRVVVDDSEDENISLFFLRAYEFIDDALCENEAGAKNVILVHCAKGVSRSATIVIMYLMKSLNIPFEEAYGFVKKHREFIEPNEGFVKELKLFEENRFQFRFGRSYSLGGVQSGIKFGLML